MLNEFSTYGARITYVMKKLGLKRKDLAGKLGISPQIVGKWMKDEKAPAGSSPDRIAQVLSLDVAWLKEGKGEPPYPDSLTYSDQAVRDAAPIFMALDQAFPRVDPLVMGQAALALTNALSRLQISMAEERLGKVLFSLIHKAQATGEKPTEEWAIQEILNP